MKEGYFPGVIPPDYPFKPPMVRIHISCWHARLVDADLLKWAWESWLSTETFFVCPEN
jgi:ubiquitin-protein ligase